MAVRVRLSSAQALTDGTWTKLAFATEDWDTDAEWDAVNYRFTPKIAGYYSVVLVAYMTVATLSGTHQKIATSIYKAPLTGALVACSDCSAYQTVDGNGASCHTKTLTYLTPNYYLEGWVYTLGVASQSISEVSANTYMDIMVHKVPPLPVRGAVLLQDPGIV